MPSVPSNAPSWVWLVSILVSGGLLGYIGDWVKQRRITRETPRPVREQIVANTATDSSLTIVARARDELGEDNTRLREDNERVRLELAEERSNAFAIRERHDRERADWEAREQRYLARIATLEERINDLLTEVHRLRTDVERGEG
jgi:hypothetical protein